MRKSIKHLVRRVSSSRPEVKYNKWSRPEIQSSGKLQEIFILKPYSRG